MTTGVRQAHRTYAEQILRQTPRVLSRMDRDGFSPTAGCLDRTFWAWKFTDAPGSRFQEGVCSLAYLYATPIEGSPYFENPRLLSWLELGFDYWIGLQRRSGDFDEAYPYERSLAATAFTSFYMAEAWELVGEQLSARTSDRFQRAIERAGRWLCRNDETHGFLSNHLAAAAAALAHAHRITSVGALDERSGYFLDKILDHQHSEGWYEEYGGADPGYQTHGSFYLARIFELTGDERLADSLERSFEFIAHFVHPDHSLGGEYASRNTQTYYPAGFEMMAHRSGAAAWIADEMLPAIGNADAAGLAGIDAYNLFPLLNNYVFAHRATRPGVPRATPKAPPETPGNSHFPGAGLLKVRRARFDAYVGLEKGGVVKVFDRTRRQLVHSSCGYVGQLERGGTVSNQFGVPDRPIEVSEDRVSVQGSFYEVSRPIMSPWRFLAFRLFCLTIGRSRSAAYRVKSLLVRVLIYKKQDFDLEFQRDIDVMEDGIQITDRLEGRGGAQLKSLEHGEAFTTIHMGSSKYFVQHELNPSLARPPAAERTDSSERPDEAEPIDPTALASGVVRRRTVRVS